MNEHAPHQAVILVQYEIQELRPDGKMNGRKVHGESKLYTFTGVDLEDTKQQVNSFLERINNGSKT